MFRAHKTHPSFQVALGSEHEQVLLPHFRTKPHQFGKKQNQNTNITSYMVRKRLRNTSPEFIYKINRYPYKQTQKEGFSAPALFLCSVSETFIC